MELERVLNRLAEAARRVIEADATTVCLLDEDGHHLTVAAVCGPATASWPSRSVRVDDSPLDREALSGHPVVVTDSRSDPRAANAPGDFRSILCVGLVHEDTPLGTLRAYADARYRFDEQDTARLVALADLGAAAAAATRAVSALEALEVSKGQFIHVATHELRSPVSVAQSLVRGVLKGYAGEMTEKQTDVFGRISRRLDFLETLVNDLLDLAAGKSPELAEEEGPVLLNAAVGRAVLLFQPRAEEKGVEIKLQPCRDQLIVWGTEGGLDRAFVNLISNAVKYTPSGGSVIVTVRKTDGRARVEVTDTGIGIPEQALSHLFEEFYRAPNAKASGEVGTGLGLAIVKDLVERYGGRITVESQVGEGSTFTVTFPIVGR
ncbi:MAG: GAF domain-containing sensor histidine kinase [Anaerolineae bacterium]|nr:GAF domain-containing sensor histidine kinase [Anaerolineae bacterium]